MRARNVVVKRSGGGERMLVKWSGEVGPVHCSGWRNKYENGVYVDTLYVQKILQQPRVLKIWFCRIPLKEEEKEERERKDSRNLAFP
jgi:hypothetical protein